MELLFESRLEVRRVEGKMYAVQGQPTILPEPVLQPDRASPVDGGGVSCFGTVLHDGGTYRMWYQAWPKGWDGRNAQLVCCAESDDGIAWRKPVLNRVEYGSSRANNLCNLALHSPAVFIDPTAPASHRYRATGWSAGGEAVAGQTTARQGYYTAHSADGLDWHLDAATPTWDSSDVITSIWHPGRRSGLVALKYSPRVLNIRRRAIWTAELRDGAWTAPRSAIVPDEFDDVCALARGFASGDYYGMGMMPSGQGAVGFIWQFRHTLPRTAGRETGVFGTVDISLAYQAKAGDRWLHAPGRDDFLSHKAHRWLRGGIYTASGAVAVGSQQRMYFAAALESHGWYVDNRWQINPRLRDLMIQNGMDRIGMAYWPQDRLFGFRADPEGVLELDLGRVGGPCELVLNYVADAGGSVRVELPDVAGRGLAEAAPLTGDALAAVAAWQDGTRIVPPAGKGLTVRLHAERADVYAYEVRPLA